MKLFLNTKNIEDPKPATPVTPVVDQKMKKQKLETYGPLPSKAQLDYHKEELAAFIHYGMNTYTNSEWGTVEKILKTSIQLTLIQISGLRL